MSLLSALIIPCKSYFSNVFERDVRNSFSRNRANGKARVLDYQKKREKQRKQRINGDPWEFAGGCFPFPFIKDKRNTVSRDRHIYKVTLFLMLIHEAMCKYIPRKIFLRRHSQNKLKLKPNYIEIQEDRVAFRRENASPRHRTSSGRTIDTVTAATSPPSNSAGLVGASRPRVQLGSARLSLA